MRKRILHILLFSILFLNSISPVKANALEDKYDVNFYFLDLDIETTIDSIKGNVLIKATSLVANLDTFSLSLAGNLTVDSVHVAINNGTFQTASFTHPGTRVNIIMPVAATNNQQVEVKIYYHGLPTVSNGLTSLNSGFFKGSLTGGPHKFSASPPYNSATWFPCKQNLKDKADSSWFFITTASAFKGLSNGLLTNTVNLAGGKKRWEWKSKYPIDFYLISFVVCSSAETIEYWHPVGRTDSLQLSYYGYSPSNVKSILQVYSNLFGLYPFYNEKLGIANVDLGGGIENQTMIALGANYGGFESHEIAHMWFGDNVTCGSWKDVMLNEGLAEWCMSVYDEFTSVTPNAARISHFSENVTTSPVYGANMDTATIMGVFGNPNLYYKKASMVINSLRFHINNDSIFFLGLRNYQTTFGGKSALGTNFKAVMENTCGLSLTDFFDQWYYKGGAPTFNIRWAQNTSNQLFLRITETSNNINNPLFKTPVEIKITRSTGDTIVRLFISQNVSDINFACPGNVTGFSVDPNQWITNGTGTVTNDTLLLSGTFSYTTKRPVISPNPVQNLLNIKNSGPGLSKITIYNSMGQQVKALNITAAETKVDLSELSNGTYFVKIVNDQGEFNEKIIKEVK